MRRHQPMMSTALPAIATTTTTAATAARATATTATATAAGPTTAASTTSSTSTPILAGAIHTDPPTTKLGPVELLLCALRVVILGERNEAKSAAASVWLPDHRRLHNLAKGGEGPLQLLLVGAPAEPSNIEFRRHFY